MLPLRSLRRAPARLWSAAAQRGYSTALKESPADTHKTKDAAAAGQTTTAPAETAADAAAAAAEMRAVQAPNRPGTWTRSQLPREKAMTGPRFEQMVIEDQVRPLLQSQSKADHPQQPRPYAAIELIHKQPVRWRKERVVACDGGGGPLGHPRIFINLDKPQITACTYCGLPFVGGAAPRGLTANILQANEHHRKHIESLPSNPYPLNATEGAQAVN
jgi:NADH dehydrogenase (ubiquinone) Fe-S protein 6